MMTLTDKLPGKKIQKIEKKLEKSEKYLEKIENLRKKWEKNQENILKKEISKKNN